MPDYKILIADYEPRGVQQLREPLEAAGFKIEVVKDGIRAIEVFNTLKPDLTLIEAMLPKKHGFEVCEELKKTQHGSRTPIVIVTSVYKGRKYRTQALHQHRCDEYLEKPINPERLLEIVHRLIGVSPGDVAAAAAKPHAEPAPASPTPSRAPAPAPRTVVQPPAEDPTAEFEIDARLDEILSVDPTASRTGAKIDKP
jgi:DNA-binding response OmpR family regulator